MEGATAIDCQCGTGGNVDDSRTRCLPEPWQSTAQDDIDAGQVDIDHPAPLRKTPITAAGILNDRVVPFYDEHGIRLCRVLTDRGTEFCGRESHE
jgi:hypothetical protein